RAAARRGAPSGLGAVQRLPTGNPTDHSARRARRLLRVARGHPGAQGERDQRPREPGRGDPGGGRARRVVEADVCRGVPPGGGANVSQVSLGFLGSGEFDPWSEPAERWLLARSRTPDGPVLVCATASAHEGAAPYDGWANKGLEHYGSLGIAAEILPLKTREDAHREEVAAKLDGASAIFFSGGNPARLAPGAGGPALSAGPR